MHRRTSVVQNVSWESDDTRKMSGDEKDDFVGKCEIVYPAYLAYLRKKRSKTDGSHDVVRRRLYDAVHFRATDDDFFVKRVLRAIALRAHSEKIMPPFSNMTQYLDILNAAYEESRRAKQIFNKNENE